eukprot:scaffold262355_cov16-Tisochrysis_lutea.AAC.1
MTEHGGEHGREHGRQTSSGSRDHAPLLSSPQLVEQLAAMQFGGSGGLASSLHNPQQQQQQQQQRQQAELANRRVSVSGRRCSDAAIEALIKAVVQGSSPGASPSASSRWGAAREELGGPGGGAPSVLARSEAAQE